VAGKRASGARAGSRAAASPLILHADSWYKEAGLCRVRSGEHISLPITPTRELDFGSAQ